MQWDSACTCSPPWLLQRVIHPATPLLDKNSLQSITSGLPPPSKKKTPFCRAPSPFEPSRDAAHPEQRLAAELEHRKLLTFDAPLGARGLAPAVAALPPAHVHPAGRAQRGEGRRGLPPQPRDRAGGMQSTGGEPPRDGHGAGGDGERLTPAAGACCGAAGRHCCCCCCWPGGSAELCAAARSGPAWRRRRRGCGGREGRRG